MNSIINLHNVSFRYPSGVLALDSVNLDLPEGKKIALLGANGAGKSTLMLMLNGVLKPTNGHLVYKEKKYEYSKRDLRQLRKKVGYLFQDSDNQLIAPSVYEEISFGLNNISKNKVWIRQKADEAIKSFNINELINRPPHELSAGQKKIICLASILAMEPDVLVCDEPTSNLDPKHSDLTLTYLNDLNKRGKTILISTHDVNLVYDWADYVILLENAKVLCTGSTNEVFSQSKLIKKAGFKLPFIVETYLATKPDITPHKLPNSMEELVKIINTK